MERRKKTYFVQSLDRGLKILQAFTAERPELNLTEIARITGMNTTATQRFTDTLLKLGFLVRNQQREFVLGPKVLDLGFTFLSGSRLKKLADTYLADFAKTNNCTANLSILLGDMVVYLYCYVGKRLLPYTLQAGSRLSSHITSSGKVLLAALPDEILEKTIKGMTLEGVTRHSITDPKILHADILKTRQRGYGISDQELMLGLFALGVPVLNQEQRVIAAINLSVSTDDAEEKRDLLLEKLKDIGKTISYALGHGGPYPVIPTDPMGHERR